MTLEEYVAKLARIIARASKFIFLLFRPFLRFSLSPLDWTALLAQAFDVVRQSRYEAAQLGREFYDAKRMEAVGQTRDVYLDKYTFEDFVESMEPSRARFILADSGEEATVDVVNRIVKEIENGSRRTLIRAVESDPVKPRWARFDPRPPTCAFCTMMISRGAVYLSAQSGGGRLSDESAQELWERGDKSALDAMMTRWHPGCTCVVVPVYDTSNWEGRDQFLAAESLWRRATKGYKGLDALNALRRAIADQNREQTVLPTAA